MERQWLTTEEMAEVCRTNVGTVRYWRHIQYGPPGVRIGRRVLYRIDDVHAWLEGQLQEQNEGEALE